LDPILVSFQSFGSEEGFQRFSNFQPIRSHGAILDVGQGYRT